MSDQADPIADAVTAILARQALCAPEAITLDATPESLGLDSLGVVEVIFGIEEQFDISVPFNANTPEDPGFDLSSVAAIIAAVRTLVAAQAA